MTTVRACFCVITCVVAVVGGSVEPPGFLMFQGSLQAADGSPVENGPYAVSYTHLRAHET